MDEQYQKLLGATYKYLSFRQRSEKEITDYLKKKKADKQIAQKIIESLKRQKFLNDEEFARAWVESRSKNKAWRVIKFELKQKGILDDLIDKYESRIKNQGQDKKNALFLAQKRVERFKNEPFQKAREKLFRFLSSKGYDYDTIKEVVDKILSK